VITKTKAISGNSISLLAQKISDYKELVKLRLNLTVVFSAVMAYLIASVGSVLWGEVAILALGGFLVTGAANALNQVLEKDFDRQMRRTANRPLAAGRMRVSEAVMAAGFMGLVGTTLLAVFNPWAALFGMVAFLSYAFLYTPMKRLSPLAITIGAFPGALPMLIGCVAFEGQLTTLALALFALQFLWQFPHFASIGWLGFEDYKKAGFQFMLSKNGSQDPKAGLESMVYALGLIPVSLMPFFLGITGVASGVLVVAFALIYAWFSWNLYKKNTRKAALLLMFSSFFYLPMTLLVLFFDKI